MIINVYIVLSQVAVLLHTLQSNKEKQFHVLSEKVQFSLANLPFEPPWQLPLSCHQCCRGQCPFWGQCSQVKQALNDSKWFGKGIIILFCSFVHFKCNIFVSQTLPPWIALSLVSLYLTWAERRKEINSCVKSHSCVCLLPRVEENFATFFSLKFHI